MSIFFIELIGTGILVAFGLGVTSGVVLRGTRLTGNGWLVIALGWGLAYSLALLSVYPFGVAHLNPALTIGLASIGQVFWSDVFMYVSGQLIGGMCGAIVVYLQFLPHWRITADPQRKLNAFVTLPMVKNIPANLLTEVIGTFSFVFGILVIWATVEANEIKFLLIAFLVMGIALSFGSTASFALNPARDLGPRIVHYLFPIPGKGSSQWKYFWIPIVGPLLGGIFGALFYQSFYLGAFSFSIWMMFILLIGLVSWALYIEFRTGR
ncbi:MIP/aquaporin family protein [Fervidibacillus halotolerans]|uniref:Aquaporin family protein n=1 Tax=Fervidibacillus halotolerans TaxID=2980027 RepID=A0A9E8LZC1_9BACI|nr:MIP/aquaporin family protein [Fervidibacillus halotolerans]WAA11771.1 aquaporin family protein [Fervidibacillus halotolerans]